MFVFTVHCDYDFDRTILIAGNLGPASTQLDGALNVETQSPIASALWNLHTCGFDVEWFRPRCEPGAHAFSARDLYGDARIVTGPDALAALAELCEQCGFKHQC